MRFVCRVHGFLQHRCDQGLGECNRAAYRIVRLQTVLLPSRRGCVQRTPNISSVRVLDPISSACILMQDLHNLARSIEEPWEGGMSAWFNPGVSIIPIWIFVIIMLSNKYLKQHQFYEFAHLSISYSFIDIPLISR